MVKPDRLALAVITEAASGIGLLALGRSSPPPTNTVAARMRLRWPARFGGCKVSGGGSGSWSSMISPLVDMVVTMCSRAMPPLGGTGSPGTHSHHALGQSRHAVDLLNLKQAMGVHVD